MVRLWSRVLGVFASALFLFPIAVHAEESISRLQVDTILTDARILEVREELIYDFDTTPRGGIQRLFPLVTPEGDAFMALPFTELKATRDGQVIPVTQQRTPQEILLTLGDPQESLQGIHTYVLQYHVRLQGTDWSDRQEFWWPVTGDGWSVPSNDVSFSVQAPGVIQAVGCFTGHALALQQDCVIQTQGSAATVHLNRVLGVQESFSVGLTLPAKTIPPAPWWRRLQDQFQADPYLAIPFLTFVLMFIVWWLRGRDPIERRPPVPQYHVPQDLGPALLGFVRSQEVEPRLFVALCLDLARKGHLLLTCEGDLEADTIVWRLTRTNRPVGPAISRYERTWLEGLLLPGQSILLAKQEQGKHHETRQATCKALIQEAVTRGWFVSDPLHTRLRWFLVAGGVACFSGLFFLLRDPSFFWIGLSSAVIIAVFGWFMPRTTQGGADLAQEIEGFRRFLGARVHEREAFTDAPPKTPEQFSQFLPEAIALDVQLRWAKQFEGMLIPLPAYLQSSTTMWSSTILVHALSHFQHDLIRYLFLGVHESLGPYVPDQENPPE